MAIDHTADRATTYIDSLGTIESASEVLPYSKYCRSMPDLC